MSVLLPEDVRSLADAPYVVHDAIRAALHFLRYEELPEEEQPPRAIWFDEDAMKAHVERVKRRREEKYGVGGKKPIEGPVDENDAAEDLLVG